MTYPFAENDKTRCITFRLPEKLLREIEILAADIHLSENVVARNILEEYLLCNQNAPEASWVALPRSFLINLASKVNGNLISELAIETAKKCAKDIAFLMKTDFDMRDWIPVILERGRKTGLNTKNFRRDQKTVLVIRHDMGKKWSVYFQIYYQELFYELGIKAKFDQTDNIVIIELEGFI